MFTKTMLALTAAFVVATSVVSVAEAQQRAPRQQAVQPFTEAERNWFRIPEGPERLP